MATIKLPSMTRLAAAATAVLVALSVATARRAQSPAAGAMYTAPARTELDALDQRIPLSVARSHEHVNWCLPPGGQRERWRETRDGKPLFGPKSPIATAEACAAVDGRFVPRLFGWMVHVMAFESGNPTVVWGMEHDHKPE
jgi:hypothetical protein